MSLARYAAGEYPGTANLIFDQLAKGTELRGAEYKSGSIFLLTLNVECSPGGGLRPVPVPAAEPLIDPVTGLLPDALVTAVLFNPDFHPQRICLITRNHLYVYRPECPLNLSLIHTFENAVVAADCAVWLGRLYVATGTNYLLEWDGCEAPVYKSSDSDKWPEGYQYPSTVTVYEGLLVVGGFVGSSNGTESSELRSPGTENADVLVDFPVTIASRDTDRIIATIPTRWGLLISKKDNLYKLTGRDWSPESSDLTIDVHTPRVACVGPTAWCQGNYGEIYLLDRRGPHRIIDPITPAENIGAGINPIFGPDRSLSCFPTPSADVDLSTACMCVDPVANQLLIGINGYSGFEVDDPDPEEPTVPVTPPEPNPNVAITVPVFVPVTILSGTCAIEGHPIDLLCNGIYLVWNIPVINGRWTTDDAALDTIVAGDVLVARIRGCEEQSDSTPVTALERPVLASGKRLILALDLAQQAWHVRTDQYANALLWDPQLRAVRCFGPGEAGSLFQRGPAVPVKLCVGMKGLVDIYKLNQINKAVIDLVADENNFTGTFITDQRTLPSETKTLPVLDAKVMRPDDVNGNPDPPDDSALIMSEDGSGGVLTPPHRQTLEFSAPEDSLGTLSGFVLEGTVEDNANFFGIVLNFAKAGR